MLKVRKPSPALVVALVALFVSLSGTAVAAGVVPLAKRALTADKAKVADNAKKLEGQAAAKLLQRAAQMPGPASSVAGLLSTKQASDSVAPDSGREIVIACDSGKKVVSGGYATAGNVLGFDSRPISDTAWSLYLLNLGDAAAAVTLYAVCIG
jgi:xanthosine utilization system XapX-like protein